MRYEGAWYIMDRGENKKHRPRKYIGRPYLTKKEAVAALDDMLSGIADRNWHRRLFVEEIIKNIPETKPPIITEAETVELQNEATAAL